MPQLALIGIGRWGKRLLRVLDSSCQVTLCCSRSSASDRDWLRANYPAITHSFDLKDALADPQISAVAIATPVGTHAELVQRALEAGKHVFVEKPLATSVEEAAALVELAAARGLTLFVGHTFLFHHAFERLMEIAQSDPAVHLRMSWRKLGTFDSPILWNLLPHAVSMGIRLFGAPVRSATVLHERGLCTERDVLCARLELGEGWELLVDLDRCAPDTSRTITMVTAGGRMMVWHDETLSALDARGGLQQILPRGKDALEREIEAFVASWQRGVPAISDGAFGLAVVEGVAKVEAAARGVA